MSTPVKLTWRVEQAGFSELIVQYTVENAGPHPIWLLDLPLVFHEVSGVTTDTAAVQTRAGTHGTVRLVRGYLRPTNLPHVELRPAARALSPGASLDGTANVSLPLRSWHPNELVQHPIEARNAVLEIGFLESAEGFDDLTLANGTEVRVPTPLAIQSQQIVRGASKPLP